MLRQDLLEMLHAARAMSSDVGFYCDLTLRAAHLLR